MTLPLTGYRVLDLGRVWTGGMIGYILANLGAEVIKVEHIDNLDNTRLRGKPTINGIKVDGNAIELGPYFHNLNRDKLSITLNLKSPKGSELFKSLVKKSDIVTENFAAGTLTKLNLNYNSLKEIKPDLIMISVSPAGQEGPRSNFKGYAPIISSFSGLELLVGYVGDSPTGMMNFGISDPNSAAQAIFALIAAIYYREETGKGQYIDMSQMEACLVLLGEPIMEFQMNNRIMTHKGNYHSIHCPHGIYPCKGKDKWIAISVESDQAWRNFSRAIGNPSWASQKTFVSQKRRLENRHFIDKKVAEWTSGLLVEDAVKMLVKHDIAAQAVLRVEEQFNDPNFRYRKLHKKVSHPLFGKEVLFNIPWRMSNTRPAIHKSAPLLGEHNEYVYKEVLGISDKEFKNLKKDRVI